MAENYLNPHQSRRRPLTEYDMKLAAAIEDIFGRGTQDLAGLLAELNAANVVAPDGRPWTEDSLTAQLRPFGE